MEERRRVIGRPRIMESHIWIFEDKFQDWFPFQLLGMTDEEAIKWFREKKIPFVRYEKSVSRMDLENQSVLINLKLVESYDGQ